MIPFNLKKGDYTGSSGRSICNRYQKLGSVQYKCLGHDHEGDTSGVESYHGDPLLQFRFLVVDWDTVIPKDQVMVTFRMKVCENSTPVEPTEEEMNKFKKVQAY